MMVEQVVYQTRTLEVAVVDTQQQVRMLQPHLMMVVMVEMVLL